MWQVSNPKERGWYLCKVVGTNDTLPLMYNTNGFWAELSGSEFYNDPVRCYEHIKDRFETSHKMIVKLHKSSKK